MIFKKFYTLLFFFVVKISSCWSWLTNIDHAGVRTRGENLATHTCKSAAFCFVCFTDEITDAGYAWFVGLLLTFHFFCSFFVCFLFFYRYLIRKVRSLSSYFFNLCVICTYLAVRSGHRPCRLSLGCRHCRPLLDGGPTMTSCCGGRPCGGPCRRSRLPAPSSSRRSHCCGRTRGQTFLSDGDARLPNRRRRCGGDRPVGGGPGGHGGGSPPCRS